MYLLFFYTQSALSFILGKADSFLLPCPFKYLTQLDCPGCGFQRAIVALLHGDFKGSFVLYPPTAAFLISGILGFLAFIFKWDSNSKLLKSCYIATGIIVMLNYGYKILTHQLY